MEERSTGVRRALAVVGALLLFPSVVPGLGVYMAIVTVPALYVVLLPVLLATERLAPDRVWLLIPVLAALGGVIAIVAGATSSVPQSQLEIFTFGMVGWTIVAVLAWVSYQVLAERHLRRWAIAGPLVLAVNGALSAAVLSLA